MLTQQINKKKKKRGEHSAGCSSNVNSNLGKAEAGAQSHRQHVRSDCKAKQLTFNNLTLGLKTGRVLAQQVAGSRSKTNKQIKNKKDLTFMPVF